MSKNNSLPTAGLAVVDLSDGVAEEHELCPPIPSEPIFENNKGLKIK